MMKLLILLALAFAVAECQHPYFNHFYNLRLPFAPRYLRYPYQFAVDEPQVGIWMIQDEPSKLLDQSSIKEIEQADISSRQGDEKISPRFFYNNNFGSAVAVQRPAFGQNRRTIIFTSTGTQTIYTTINCFTSTLFNNPNPTTCANRRRDIEAQLNQLLTKKSPPQFEVSPVQKVETTALPSTDHAEVIKPRLVMSSKFEDSSDPDNDKIALDRTKRFFGGVFATTVTTWSFITSTIPNRIGAVFQVFNNANAGILCPVVAGGANQCLFACIPIGYTAC